jgi:hypothetical protein
LFAWISGALPSGDKPPYLRTIGAEAAMHGIAVNIKAKQMPITKNLFHFVLMVRPPLDIAHT